MRKGFRKQFCSSGHDMFVVGRTFDGHHCLGCYNEKRIGPKPKNPLCVNGHNKDIVGRTSDGACKMCKKLRDREYNQKNKEKVDKIKRQYVMTYPEIGRKAKKKYSAKHPEVRIKYKTNRNLRVAAFGQEGIREFLLATPVGMVVDHIIPLCGKKVSGLNVIWNLQYLTPKVNGHKGNKCDLKKASEWYGKMLEDEEACR